MLTLKKMHPACNNGMGQWSENGADLWCGSDQHTHIHTIISNCLVKTYVSSLFDVRLL